MKTSALFARLEDEKGYPLPAWWNFRIRSQLRVKLQDNKYHKAGN